MTSPAVPYCPWCRNAYAGLTQLTNCKNADAGLTFSSVSGIPAFTYNSRGIMGGGGGGFPHHLSVQQEAHPWGALAGLTAPCWVTLHLVELCCTLLSYAALCWDTLPTPCILLSYAAPFWTTLHLQNNAPPYWATGHFTELRCTLLGYTVVMVCPAAKLHPLWASSPWAMLHPTELPCILLSYAAPYWSMLHPVSYATP
jgi:hypothetical protein